MVEKNQQMDIDSQTNNKENTQTKVEDNNTTNNTTDNDNNVNNTKKDDPEAKKKREQKLLEVFSKLDQKMEQNEMEKMNRCIIF